MKISIIGLCLMVISVQSSYAQNNTNTPSTYNTPEQQEIVNLSKRKRDGIKLAIKDEMAKEAETKVRKWLQKIKVIE